MSTKIYDVVILGAGTAGLNARRQVAKVTDNYLVVDPGILGTTCARVGCMPSKVLIQVAEDFFRQHSWEEEGLRAERFLLDSKKVMQHVRKLRDRFVRSVISSMESWKNEKYFQAKRAEFIDNHHLKLIDPQTLEEEIVYAHKAIIACGTKPAIPQELSDVQKFLVTTDEFFELDDLPKSIAVVGLGVIGLELGQALTRLGVSTFGIARREALAGITDPVVFKKAREYFKKKIKIHFYGIAEARVLPSGLCQLTLGDCTTIEVEKILATSGRVADFQKLGLQNTTAQFQENGYPLFCGQSFQVLGTDHLFIAGDATGEKQVLHEASDEGKIAGHNAVNPRTNFKTRTPLLIAFTDPQVALVGESFQNLVEKKKNFVTGEVSFQGQGRSIIKLKEYGHLRVYVDEDNFKLLGAELFAPDGEHLAHLLSWSLSRGETIFEILAHPFYHPVVEEGLRTALREARDKIFALKSFSPEILLRHQFELPL